MNKQKVFVFRGLISILGAILLLLSLQFVSSANARVFADDKGNSQTELLFTSENWTEANADYKKQIFDLFTDAKNGEETVPYFECGNYGGNRWGVSNYSSYSSGMYTYHKKSSSDLSPNNGYLKSTFTLSDGMHFALSKGYLTIEASANFGSDDNGQGKDKLDTVVMSFAGQSISKVEKLVDGAAGASIFTQNGVSYGNSFELLFESTHTYNPDAFFGATSTIMKVQNPTITLETSDVTIPTIAGLSISDADRYSPSKTASFVVNDSESGVDRVVVTKNGEVLADVDTYYDDDTTRESMHCSFTIDQNNATYEIVAYDNVGNISESTSFVSSKIDSLAPVVDFGFEEGATFDQRSFSLAINKGEYEIVSPEEYYYTLDGPMSIARTQFTFDDMGHFILNLNTSKVGTYSLSVYAVDEAGNELNITRNFVLNISYFDYSITTHIGGNHPSESTVADSNIFIGTTINYSTADFTDNGTTYTVYRVLVGGEPVDTALESFVIDQDMVVDIYYREVVSITFGETNYDGTGSPLDIDYTATCPSEVLNWQITKGGVECSFSSAGEYTVTASVDDINYVGSATATLTILNPVSVTIGNLDYDYNPTGFVFDMTLSNSAVSYELIFTDTDGSEFTPIEAKQNSLNAGEYTYRLTILNAGYYIAGTTFGNNTMSGSFVVNPRTVILPEFAESKVYDGTEYALGETYGGYGVSVQFTQNNAAATPIDAGVYDVLITITQSNYVGNIAGTLTINKKELNVIANSLSSVYGEEFLPLAYTCTDFVDGENYDFTLTANLDSNAGEYDIDFVVPSDMATHEILKNYQPNFVGAKYTVTQKTAVVSVKANQSKQYGEADPVEYEYYCAGVLEGDDLGLILSREPGEDVGTYAITLVDYTNKNYTIEFLSDNYKITARKLIISADAVYKVYDGTDTLPNLTYSVLYGEILERDIADFDINLETSATPNVGKYLITAGSVSSANYNIVFMNNYLYITPRDVTITAVDAHKNYGDSDPMLSYLVDGDADSSVTFSGKLSRQKGEKVGEYEITLGTLANKNYSITFVPATFTINKAPLIITAQNATKTYGEAKDPAFTYTTDKKVKASDLRGKLTREAGEHAGKYVILGDYESDCYEITFVAGEFTIVPATAYISMTNQSKVYGSADPEFSYSISGVLPNNIDYIDENIVLTREAGENVGEYILSASCESNDYNFVVSNALFTITKANASIVMPDATFTYDGTAKMPVATLDVDGELTYKITKDGETVTSAISAGEYRIEASFAGNENYFGAKKTALFVINKADIEVTVYRDVFVMKKDNSIQEPEIECAVDSGEYSIVFDDENAGTIGTHAYTIVFSNQNYNAIRGTVRILPIPTNTTAGGSVEFVTGSVDNENVNLIIQKTEDKNSAQNATNMVVDSTYELMYNQNGDTQVKVELDYDSNDYSNVYVYVYTDDGEAKLVPYEVVDGKIVLNIDADNVKLAVVRQVAGISFATIVMIALLCGLTTYGYMHRRKMKKIKRVLRVA